MKIKKMSEPTHKIKREYRNKKRAACMSVGSQRLSDENPMCSRR